MRIVVNHLTRMREGYICVAGIDLDTGAHVRPVLERVNLGITLLRKYRGPFDMAAVVELGTTRYVGKAPELEDHQFIRERAHWEQDMPPAEFWGLLEQIAQPKLSDIFGDDLRCQGASCTIEVGRGRASLGCLLPARPPHLRIDDRNNIRLGLFDGSHSLNLNVNDLRLYMKDNVTPRRDAVLQVTQRIAQGVGVILSVGLSRAWQKPGEAAAKHWLQVNNIHLEDDPGWKQSA